MRSDRHIMSFGHCRDLPCFGDAARMTDVWLDNIDRPFTEEIEIEVTRKKSFASRYRNSKRRDSSTNF